MVISVPRPKKASSPAALNMPDAEPGLLALLGQLGLGQPHLAADQLGDLLGQPVHERADRLLRRRVPRPCLRLAHALPVPDSTGSQTPDGPGDAVEDVGLGGDEVVGPRTPQDPGEDQGARRR